MSLTKDQLLKTAKDDPKKIIESLLSIEDKEGNIVPFIFNAVQSKYYEQRTKRDDILKARQQGCSSLILALFTIDFLVRPNIWCVCVSHEKKATTRLFRKVHNYLKRLPFSVPLDTSRTDMIVNKANNSIFYIGTAGSKSFGQGDTIHRLHLSEFAKYPDPDRIMKNLIPAVPKDGVIIKETTANGMNNLHHREWVKEKKGESPFRAFFSPWFDTPEYAVPTQHLVLTIEEKELEKQFGLSLSQMKWRRDKVVELGSEDGFKEQYPATDLEAFISSGTSAFSKKDLAWFYTNTCRPPGFRGVLTEAAGFDMQEDPKGYFKLWEKPLPNSQYFIPADVGKSGDYCSASVWHWARLEQVATVHGHFEPDEFGNILFKVGLWFNQATIIPENNGLGAGTVASLRNLNYPALYVKKELKDARTGADEVVQYGFNTNTRTRPLIIASGQKAVSQRSPIIRDEEHIMEMQSFQRNPDGKFEAARDARGVELDDRVMEFLIGMYFHQTTPIPDFKGLGLENPIAAPDNQPAIGEGYASAQLWDQVYDDFTV